MSIRGVDELLCLLGLDVNQAPLDLRNRTSGKSLFIPSDATYGAHR
jgi:hypothetical protein